MYKDMLANKKKNDACKDMCMGTNNHARDVFLDGGMSEHARCVHEWIDG